MASVVGVKFKKSSKVHNFDPCGLRLEPGTSVIAETARGLEMGVVETSSRELPNASLNSLRKITRTATEADLRQDARNRKREEEAWETFVKKAAEHRLEMNLVNVEMTFDASKIIFYFTANGRVDFRELVKALATFFKMRIELRQIGVRDEAQILNSIAVCGRALCCSSFLSDFQPVSIKMAKDQNISLNPAKISGVCGRLMCCLKYEQDTYEQLGKGLPSTGDTVSTPDGSGEVLSVTPLRRLVKVAVKKNAGEEVEVAAYSADEIKILKRGKPEETVTTHKKGASYDKRP
ncbi:MAG: stage 0 sporulation family protein [Clostridiales bacterium]|jgi:cell fate regulator YaaT (PSP1 superfamily)|nr:stage 0 sporulation family protein [Clostridiales bacterium]